MDVNKEICKYIVHSQVIAGMIREALFVSASVSLNGISFGSVVSIKESDRRSNDADRFFFVTNYNSASVETPTQVIIHFRSLVISFTSEDIIEHKNTLQLKFPEKIEVRNFRQEERVDAK